MVEICDYQADQQRYRPQSAAHLPVGSEQCGSEVR
jgi:hypothetical protein